MLHALMKMFSLLLGIDTYAPYEAVNVSIKYMYFDRHPAAHFDVIFHQIPESQPIQQFSASWFPRKSLNRDTTEPCFILSCSEKVGKCLTLNNFLDLQSIQNASFNFASENFGDRCSRCLKIEDFLSNADTNCFMSPSFMCKDGISNFWKYLSSQ